MKKVLVLVVAILLASTVIVTAGCGSTSTSEPATQTTTPETTSPVTAAPPEVTAPAPAPATSPTPPPATGPKPEEITLGEFNQIQDGMNYEQVVAIVGGPGVNTANIPGLDVEPLENGVTYMFYGPGSNAGATVVFQNGVVIGKAQQGLL